MKHRLTEPGCRPPRRPRGRDPRRPDLVQDSLRAASAQGLHQGRARPALRSHRAQHPRARCRRGIERFPEIITRLRHDRPVHHDARLRRRRLHLGHHPRGPPTALPARGHPHRWHRPQQGPGSRAVLSAAVALAAAPEDSPLPSTAPRSTQDRTRRLHRPASPYDLRKFRAKGLAVKPGAPAATRSPPRPPGPSPPCSPSATRSSPRSWPGVRSPRQGRKPATGPASTATTKPSASTCRPSSPTSASQPQPQPPHRQHFVDRRNGTVILTV